MRIINLDMRAQFVIPPEFRKISGVSNKISLWRQPAALKGLNSGMVSGNLITTLSPQDRLESASCSATHGFYLYYVVNLFRSFWKNCSWIISRAFKCYSINWRRYESNSTF